MTPPSPNGTCETGWYPYLGKCYYYGLSQPLSAADASIYCHQRQSSLVSIHDQSVNQFLVRTITTLMSGTEGGFWTGLHKSLDCKHELLFTCLVKG